LLQLSTTKEPGLADSEVYAENVQQQSPQKQAQRDRKDICSPQRATYYLGLSCPLIPTRPTPSAAHRDRSSATLGPKPLLAHPRSRIYWCPRPGTVTRVPVLAFSVISFKTEWILGVLGCPIVYNQGSPKSPMYTCHPRPLTVDLTPRLFSFLARNRPVFSRITIPATGYDRFLENLL